METLSGFDPSTMTYLASQMVHPGVGGQHSLHDLMMPLELPDHRSNYCYSGSDDFTVHHPQQTTPQLKHFASSYDDPNSDVVSALDGQANDTAKLDADEPRIARGHEMLSFSVPSLEYTLLDFSNRRTTISMTAQLHGMFFNAESSGTTAGGDVQPPRSDLTCYRRNIFQISGQIHLPRALHYLVTDTGEQIPIIAQELTVSAVESTESNPVKIIAVPWKTPANAGANPAGASAVPPVETKAEREPQAVPLDLLGGPDATVDNDRDYVRHDFSWKRLQFRIATANNGRRKELQQHFVLRLRVQATLATGGHVKICEVQSQPIIVRGRSPRNFQSRKDMPLTGSGSVRRTSSHHLASGELSRRSSNDNIRRPALGEAATSAPFHLSRPPTSQPIISPTAEVSDFFDWSNPDPMPQLHGPVAAGPTPFSNYQIDNAGLGAEMYPSPSPGLPRKARLQSSVSAPINLSLVEGESPRSAADSTSSVSAASQQQLAVSAPANLGGGSNSGGGATPTGGRRQTYPPSHPSHHHHQLSNPPPPPQSRRRAPSYALLTNTDSPGDSADLLYEYFPLGLDDWMPPVDAVYRPHVVHHTKLPLDPRLAVKGARSRRYFVEDIV